ncbi:MAG: hypothetical protein N2109_08515 [Fimbriimonadales bacterium]|nr:hypothetical protein [Fimbriimonadales bacterium]
MVRLPLRSVCLVLWLLGAALATAMGYRAYPPTPQGVLRYARAEIGWRVAPYGGARVTGVSLHLDGLPVPARYDADSGAVVWRPEQPLAPGRHTVRCVVEFDGRHRAEKEWSFEVAPGAAVALPEARTEQLRALDRANELRRRLGLPEFWHEPSLAAAASSHSAFLAANRAMGHAQDPSMPGFTGRTARERAMAFGFAGSVWEDVAFSARPDADLVRELFDAPYHRLPFLQPGRVPFGAGLEGRFLTLNFGATSESGLTVSPAPDETQVPPSWDGIETPCPLEPHGLKGPVGYPIVVAWFGQGRLELLSASVEGPEGPVETAWNHPANDPNLEQAAFLIPRRPLRPGACYKVSVRVRVDGRELARSWSFETAR